VTPTINSIKSGLGYRFLHAYAAHSLGEYRVYRSMCNTLVEEIEKIKNNKLESFYRFRLSQLLMHLYLWQNEVIKARRQAKFIIDFCPQDMYKANAYHFLGLSYLYSDIDKGNRAFEKELAIVSVLQ
jgi:hypothetical protein